MFQISILQFAPTKNSNVKALESDFEKRLRPFAKFDEITLPASKSDEPDRAQKEELALAEKKLDPHASLIALDENGKLLTSEEFAELLRQVRDHGPGRAQLLIGGSHGLHPELLQKAQHKIALSRMTFTHEMVRVFLKEQIYRALSILHGQPYHK